MKIKMLVSMAGVDFTLDVGSETDRFPGDEAIRLIEAGYAEPVAGGETERAVKKGGRKKR